MFNELYINFNIKHNKRYRSVRVPTYLILDYIYYSLKNHNIKDMPNYKLKKYKEEITENLQNLYDKNPMNSNQDNQTFIFYLNTLIYKDILKNHSIKFNIFIKK
jgi:hypothetical protein